MGAQLPIKQENFVLGLVQGKSQRAAYKAAYSTAKMKDKTIDEKASRLFSNDKVRARYEELRGRIAKEAEDECIISIKEILIEISDIGRDTREKTADRLKALEMAGRHLGMFKDKIEVSGGLATAQTKLDKLLEELSGG